MLLTHLTPVSWCLLLPADTRADTPAVLLPPAVQMVREGTDVSIFTYSRMRYVVMQAVAELEKKGYNPEV